MRWIGFVILLYVVTVLQSTLAPFIAVHTIRPDIMVIVAVHYALLVRGYDAMLACWCIGLATDLAGLSYPSDSNVGVNAFSLGFIAIVIVKVRELTFRDSAVTQLVLTFLTKLTLALIVGVHMLYVLDEWHRFGEVATAAVWAAVYTALLAPYGHWMLRRFRGALGIGLPDRLRVR